MKTLREYIDLLESINQPVKSGPEIAASLAPVIDKLDSMDVNLKEEELDEINWRKGLAGAAAAGALALGGAQPSEAADLGTCLATFKIAANVSTQNGDPETARLLNQAFLNTGKLLNPGWGRADMNDFANANSDFALQNIQGMGIGGAVKDCINTLKWQANRR